MKKKELFLLRISCWSRQRLPFDPSILWSMESFQTINVIKFTLFKKRKREKCGCWLWWCNTFCYILLLIYLTNNIETVKLLSRIVTIKSFTLISLGAETFVHNNKEKLFATISFYKFGRSSVRKSFSAISICFL